MDSANLIASTDGEHEPRHCEPDEPSTSWRRALSLHERRRSLPRRGWDRDVSSLPGAGYRRGRLHRPGPRYAAIDTGGDGGHRAGRQPRPRRLPRPGLLLVCPAASFGAVVRDEVPIEAYSRLLSFARPDGGFTTYLTSDVDSTSDRRSKASSSSIPPFELSLLARCLLLLGRFEDAEKVIGSLLRLQDADGSWPSPPILRVTRLSCFAPWHEPNPGPLYADQERLFTTATALRSLANWHSGNGRSFHAAT